MSEHTTKKRQQKPSTIFVSRSARFAAFQVKVGCLLVRKIMSVCVAAENKLEDENFGVANGTKKQQTARIISTFLLAAN